MIAKIIGKIIWSIVWLVVLLVMVPFAVLGFILDPMSAGNFFKSDFT